MIFTTSCLITNWIVYNTAFMYNRSYFNLYVNSTLPLNQYLCHWDSLEEDQCPWSHNHLNCDRKVLERYRIRFMANGKCEIQVDNFIKIGNSIGQVTVQTTYLILFLLIKLAKNCYLFCANVIILMNSELTRKNLVMSNKLTFAIIWFTVTLF